MERIRLDIIPKGLMPVCHASQYDAGRVIRLDLMDGLQGYSLTNEEIELNVRKPDGHIVTASVDVVEGQTYVDIVTTEQMCAVEGENICELKISKDDAEIYSLNFKMMVEKSVTEGGDPSESFIYNLRTQIAEGVAEEVAEQYDSANVIFDNEPTENHGIGYTVTSEGIKTAIDNAFDYDNTASGSLVHITDGADNIPVKSLVSQIVAVESGNGQPKSPDNPYTISGFDNAVITRCGKNFVSDKIARSTILTNGSIASPDNNHDMFLAEIKQGVTYTIKSDENTSPSRQFVGAFFTSKPTVGSVSYNGTRLADVSATFTAPITGWVAFRASHDYAYAQCEKGDEQTTFEPYNGNTYTFTFGQTVYGGYFDNGGNLVVTHGYAKGFTASHVGTTPSGLKYCDVSISGLVRNAIAVSNIYKWKNADSTSADNSFKTFTNVITFYDSRFTDVATANTILADVEVVYALATPITLSITSQDIPTLLGENNIFSNCGDVEVTYYTSKSNDILEFIDSEIGKKNGTNIPIEENSQDSIKDYVDNKVSSINLESLPDTDITSPSASQVLSFDGNNWVNTNQIAVKYEEKDIAFDSSGEGTLYYANGYILGLKDIPSDSLYIGYITYMAGTKTMVKGFNRSATSFDSMAIANTTRKIGIYYLDNIATQ